MTRNGIFFYMCTRNNNFSNRSQKGKIVAVSGKTQSDEAGGEGSSLKDYDRSIKALNAEVKDENLAEEKDGATENAAEYSGGVVNEASSDGKDVEEKASTNYVSADDKAEKTPDDKDAFKSVDDGGSDIEAQKSSDIKMGSDSGENTATSFKKTFSDELDTIDKEESNGAGQVENPSDNSVK